MTRVLIADDHATFRRALRTLLESLDDVEVVGEASQGYEALSLMGSVKPDLVVMDVVMPINHGLEVASEALAMGLTIPILFVSMHRNPELVERALGTGAVGFVLKETVFEDLPRAIAAVRAGEVFVSSSLVPGKSPAAARTRGEPSPADETEPR
jgi:DNA-binding NarL/FixJ family response regulator